MFCLFWIKVGSKSGGIVDGCMFIKGIGDYFGWILGIVYVNFVGIVL